MTDLFNLFTPAQVDAIEQLIDERVREALEEQKQKRWLTTAETADYLGISVKAVYGRIDSGRIPAAAVKHSGRALVVDRLALDRATEALP